MSYFKNTALKTLTIQGEEELPEVVATYLALAGECKVAILYGELGAGKTTFVKSLVHHFGTDDEISSPTYSLVNEYETHKGTLYHIDLYRLDDTDEALDIGIEEYLFSKTYCFIEWPQIIEGLLEEAIEIRIIANDDGSRTFEFAKVEMSGKVV